MKKLLLVTLSAGVFFLAQAQQSSIDLGRPTGQIISRYIYGQFAEHLGNCIYDGFYRKGQIRMDIVKALKDIRVPLLRWPGGCFADQYHWRDGIGDKKGRPARVNSSWGMVIEDNSFGTHEFLQLCDLIGCEPYIGANVGTGSPEEMKEWIEYLNYDGPSELAKLRAMNGHPAPYHIKFWGVGNESWGCGGRMTAEEYANKYREFAEFCKDYPGSPLKKIASGAFDDDYHWTETLMKNVSLRRIQGLSYHYYASVDGSGKNHADHFNELQYFKGLKSGLHMDELIRRHSAIMDVYDPDKKVWLVVDEWGAWYGKGTELAPEYNLSQQSTMRDALLTGITLDIFQRHADKVAVANVAQSINCIHSLMLAQGDKFTVTPTFHVFQMYLPHRGAQAIRAEFTAPAISNPLANAPIPVGGNSYRGSLEAVKSLAGLSGSASIATSGNGKRLTLSVVNPHLDKPLTTEVAVRGASIASAKGTVLVSKDVHDHNDFAHPNAVKPAAATLTAPTGGRLLHTFPPASVTTLELTLA